MREGRPEVYLDETWCNFHDGKDIAWRETDKTCPGGTVLGPVGLDSFVSAVKDDVIYVMPITSHLERGNILLCCMQVAKMAGSLVSIMCSEVANMRLLQVVIGNLNQRKDLLIIMMKRMPPVLKNGLKKSCFQPCPQTQ